MSKLTFNREQWNRLATGAKTATVRRGLRKFAPGPAVVECNGLLGLINIWEVSITTFKDIGADETLHEREGYADIDELKQVMLRMYPDMRPDETITIISFEKVWLQS